MREMKEGTRKRGRRGIRGGHSFKRWVRKRKLGKLMKGEKNSSGMEKGKES